MLSVIKSLGCGSADLEFRTDLDYFDGYLVMFFAEIESQISADLKWLLCLGWELISVVLVVGFFGCSMILEWSLLLQRCIYILTCSSVVGWCVFDFRSECGVHE